MRILIIKPSSLGDVVQSLPVAAHLKKALPAARISWLINDSLAGLLENCPAIDEVLLFQRKRWGDPRYLAEFIRFLRTLRGREFDAVVDLQGLLRSGFMTFATGAPCRIGFSDAREFSRIFYNQVVSVDRWSGHLVRRYLMAVSDLVSNVDAEIEFPIARFPDARTRVDALLDQFGLSLKQPLVALHPGARWSTKRWFPERFAELADGLTSQCGVKVLIVGSSDEAELAGAIAGATKLCRPVLLTGKTDLQMLVELLRGVRVLVSHDTGPMHIAAAVGTSCVAIFGASDPVASGPYPLDRVTHVVLSSGVECAPCFSTKCRSRNPMECMGRISVGEVLTSVRALL